MNKFSEAYKGIFGGKYDPMTNEWVNDVYQFLPQIREALQIASKLQEHPYTATFQEQEPFDSKVTKKERLTDKEPFQVDWGKTVPWKL